MTNNNEEPPPEAPEVRRSYEGLVNEIGQGKITEITVIGGRYRIGGIPGGFNDTEFPIRVVGGGVKGKLMWLEFHNGKAMLITLGMSGYWSTSPHKHAHVVLVIDHVKPIYYVDQRRFGTLKIIDSGKDLQRKINSLGLDLLNTDVEFDEFRNRLMMGKNKPICETLMDQRILAGVGNYIKCEALYEAKISPFTQTNVLNVPETARLFKSLQRIMKASYSQGGASIRNYQQVNGDPGEYVFSFSVYGQETDPHGREVVREKTSDGRTTHWVPNAQF